MDGNVVYGKKYSSFALVILMATVSSAMSGQTALVRTQYGNIQGGEENGIQKFLGIPYAAPPIGALRFRSPQEPNAWKGILTANVMAPSAPQRKNRMSRLSNFSEDCLYLNIWTPGSDKKKRPVMFWIHGGGLVMGSAAQDHYEGTKLSKRGDVVVVTINYRLGALGLALLDDTLPTEYQVTANLSLQDQIQALRWVHDNIGSFGGDPENVTIFGESGGGRSVGSLMASSKARGLFHKAICQSGTLTRIVPREEAARVAHAFLEALGISADNPQKLWKVSVDEILRAQGELDKRIIRAETAYGAVLNPVADGDILPLDPFAALVKGSAKDIAFMTGTNLDEENLFIYTVRRDRLSLDFDGLVKECEVRVPGQGRRLARAYKSALESQGRGARPSQVFGAMETDRVFRIPTLRVIEAQAKHQKDCFLYLFDLQSTLAGIEIGAFHGSEIPFVFGNFGPGRKRSGVSDLEKDFLDKMMDAWIAFARRGNPNHNNLPHWPAYDTQNRPTMRLGLECRVEDDPMSVERRLWDGKF